MEKDLNESCKVPIQESVGQMVVGAGPLLHPPVIYSQHRAKAFLEPSTSADFQIALDAYDNARKALSGIIPPLELASIDDPSMIEEILAITEQMHSLRANLPGSQRIRTTVSTLQTYMGIFDVLSQTNATFTPLVWGFMKWIIVFAAKYVQTMQRVSDMLEDISYSLPRIQLYQHMMPTKRMSQLISELYAALIDFLVKTICFIHKRRVRRFWSSFWGPFECEYQNCMGRIRRLSACVDKDAQATAIVQQQAQSSSFARHLNELNLVTRHTFQSLLSVKECQTKMLLHSIRENVCDKDVYDHEFNSKKTKPGTSRNALEHDSRLWESKQISWHEKGKSTIIGTTPDASFSDRTGFFGLDICVCEGLFRVTLLQLGIASNSGTCIERTTWSDLWASLRCAFVVHAYAALDDVLLDHPGFRTNHDRTELKVAVTDFLKCVDLAIPEECQQQLQKLLGDMYTTHDVAEGGRKSDESSFDECGSQWYPQPINAHQRSLIWRDLERIIRSVVHYSFQSFVRRQLKVASKGLGAAYNPLLHIKSILSPKEWDASALKMVRDEVVSCLRQAAETGLRYVMPLYLNSKAEHEQRVATERAASKNPLSISLQQPVLGVTDWLPLV